MGNPVTSAFPELLIASGTEAGYRWEVSSNKMGFRCGYVRVPAGHPWHGKDYDAVEPYPDVHGGLTFARPDTSDLSWWLGFDCAHAGDAPDPALPGYEHIGLTWAGIIRDTLYVVGQCLELAFQAASAGRYELRERPAAGLLRWHAVAVVRPVLMTGIGVI